MDKPIPEAVQKPNFRALAKDLNVNVLRCIEGVLEKHSAAILSELYDDVQRQKALTAAQQQGQADEEAAAYEQAHRAGESHGRIMAALEQSMQQGGGEGCQWAHEVVVRGQSAATSSGTGCAATGGRCVPGTTPDCPSAPPSAPVGVEWPVDVLSREKTLKVLREHNAWRRGAKGPQTDPRMLGLALDAAIAALAAQQPAAVDEAMVMVQKHDALILANFATTHGGAMEQLAARRITSLATQHQEPTT